MNISWSCCSYLFLLAVERLKECRDFMYGVVGPLQNALTEERGDGTCVFCMHAVGRAVSVSFYTRDSPYLSGESG